MKTPLSDRVFAPREISVLINNAVIGSMRPHVGSIPEKRMRSLRNYCEALVELTPEHVEEGLLSYEELVFVLLSSALMIQQLHVQGVDRLPGVAASKALFREKK